MNRVAQFLKTHRGLAMAAIFAACLPVLAAAGLQQAVERADGVLPTVETSMLVTDRDGVLLRPFPVSDGRWRLPVALDAVDPDYVRMLLAYEDRRFFAHRGVDVRALVRAGLQLAGNGRIVSGGSTLTMQVARLLGGRNTRGAGRKADQILWALALEAAHGKTEILEAYVNLAPFGGNLEGVRTAALAYFGKEPKRLSAAEAALLVALPQAPESRRPDRFPDAARAARNRVLMRALSAGLIDRRAYDRAIATPVPNLRRAMPMLAPHLAETARAAHPGRAEIGLRIDAALQRQLQDLALRRLAQASQEHSIALVVADIKTGDVLASVGSPDYFRKRNNGFVDMTTAVRSPGSTLKPLIYALAFSDGIAHPESLIEDRPIAFSGYAPANFDRDYQGTVTVRDALQLSLNVPAVQLLDALGPARLLLTMRKAGARPVLPDGAPPSLAIGLGGVGVTLMDLVSIYRSLASGGYYLPLRTGAGTGGGQAAPEPEQVLDPRAAWMTASILAGARDPRGMLGGGFAFKTGTTYGYRDAWAIGFDGKHVVGVWTGRPDGKPVPGLVGIDVAAPILADVFARLGKVAPLPPAPPGVSSMRTADLPLHMRHVGRAAAEVSAETGGPELAYPPDLARIDLDLAGSDAAPLHLKVRNGHLPLTFLVNGAPIAQKSFSRTAEWRPDSEGFADIVVIDAKGAAARAKVFLQ